MLLTLIRAGRLTPKIWTVEEGGRLHLEDKIAGSFTLDKTEPAKDLVLVATGTGLAPFMSMLRHFSPSAQRRWRRCALIHGVRLPEDLAYHQELEALATRDASLHYLPVCSRTEARHLWTGRTGRVQTILHPATFAALTGWPLDPSQGHVMLCGNPQMIQETAADLTARGFVESTHEAPGTLHYERYW